MADINPCPSSTVSPYQEPASAIPGNIGIARAKVEIWEHDPLYGGPHQQTEYPFSQSARFNLEAAGNAPNAEFEAGSVFLKPEYQVHNTWIGTIKDSGSKTPEILGPLGQSIGLGGQKIYGIDLVKPQSAETYYPGGENYKLNGRADENGKADDTTGRDIFWHQTWLHRGSLLKQGVPLHPSEYDTDLASVGNITNLAKLVTDLLGRLVRKPTDTFDKYTLSELYAAPKWYYEKFNDNGKTAFWPAVINTPSPDGMNTTHWTIEKLTPTWQGEDFFITIRMGTQETADAVDPGPNSASPDLIDTNWEEYKYLLFKKPEKTEPSESAPIGISDDENVITNWIDGISNEAFYIEPGKSGSAAGVSDEDRVEVEKSARERYWWKYKTYILIEMGALHPEHNYFIELVKGRNPRLLHLGWEWDNPKKLSEEIATSEDWGWIKKCRVIDEFDAFLCDELFRKRDFRIKVRNHIGRLVITFDGYDDQPWIITRKDHDESRYDYFEKPVPMVVPAGRMRIHGGNISCAVGFAPTRYARTANLLFPDRQADTYEAENNDLWMTFATVGMPYTERSNDRLRSLFRDERFGIRTIGFRADIGSVQEVHRNVKKVWDPYREFFVRYRKYGKGFVLPNSVPNPNQGVRFALKDAMDPSKNSGAQRHNAKIVNADKPQQTSQIFNLTIENDPKYEFAEAHKDKIGIWNVGVKMEAGTLLMPKFTGGYIRNDGGLVSIPEAQDTDDKLFVGYVTPVIPQWSYIVLGGAKPFEDRVSPIDISNLVTNIHDSWSSEGFNCINHTMKMTCYIPDSFLPASTNPGPGQIDQNLHAIGQKLLSLHKQGFYITIKYWWDNGVGERDAPANKISRSNNPEFSDLLIQMSGIAKGATLEKSVNKLFMHFEINDYSRILEDQLIWNSPFFDGVDDAEAVYELARMASFDDSYLQPRRIDRRPLSFLAKVLTDRYVRETTKLIWNGEESRFRPYDLKGSYSDFQNASMRFQNGETYWSAMKKIATLGSKVVYFDRWGVLRLENSPAVEAAFAGRDFNNGDFEPKFQFVTSPFNVSAAGGDPASTAARRFRFNPNLHASHLVYNVITYSRSVQDACSQIILYTASNELLLENGTTVGGFIVRGHTFFDQILDPSAEGFLGYRKPWYQSDGVFGSVEALREAIQHYAQTKYPPAIVQFETYGVPGLKPLDIITLDDDLFYITEISHEIDPSTNRWWMNITAQWLKPFLGDIGILSPKGSTDSGSGRDGDDGDSGNTGG